MRNNLLIGTIFYLLASPSGAAATEWLTDVPAALAKAKAENKNALLFFTGSDWCGWCKKLKREVFGQPEFLTYAQTNFVLVELDFPKAIPQTPELQAANAALAEKFEITGYPTVIILDADGNKLARGGYLEGGAANYIAALEKIPGGKSQAASNATSAEAPTPTVPVNSSPAFSPQPAPVIRYTELTLKGITGAKNRRFALINNQTLAVGEKAKVKLGEKQIDVLCQEIRDDSVLIKVEGEAEPKELKLKNQ